MATGHRTYYLVKNSQFWEIKIKGKETVIRGGKVGCKGRLYPAKEHPTPAKALQFAQQQVNAKIILGFESEDEENIKNSSETQTPASQNVKRLPSTSSSAKTLLVNRPKQPPKKRDTIRRLVQQKSLRSQDHGQATNGNAPTADKTITVATWRKPPKKQSTIRRFARRESIIRQARAELKQAKEYLTPTKRKLSFTQKGSSLKKYPKKQLFSDKTMPAMPSSPGVMTRQASRHLSEPEDKPRTLGTVTFLAKSPTLPVDVEMIEEPIKTDSMPVLSREETIKLDNKRKPGLSTAPSLTVGPGDVYIPAAADWPMQLSAPVLWSEMNFSESEVCANAVYVDDQICIYGDDSGKVVQLSSTGQILQTYQLHTKVRYIQKQEGFLYVGCSDGVIYEISNGTPYQMYRPPTSSFREVQGLVLYDNVLVTSNVKGQLCAVDHDGKVLWRKKSMGDGGWMLCADESGVYHGHSGGVTKYVLQDGSQLWYRKWTASIFGVVQSETYLYVADNVRIKKLRKDTGAHEKTYAHKGSGCIMSVGMGGGLLFAAGSACITCYEEASAQVVYRLLHGGQPLGLQYHQGRLYCVGAGGLSVIDLSESSIKQNKGSKHPVHTLPSSLTSSCSISPLKKAPTLPTPTSSAVTLKCVKDTMVRVLPDGNQFNCDLSVEFPINIRKVGAKYVVNDLKASNTGAFYRITGSVFEVE